MSILLYILIEYQAEPDRFMPLQVLEYVVMIYKQQMREWQKKHGNLDIGALIYNEEKCHPVQGYVFYHLQCTERAIKSGQLFLAFGSVEEDVAIFLRVANKIVAELHRVGLDAKWQGTAGHPIVVHGIVWQKRR